MKQIVIALVMSVVCGLSFQAFAEEATKLERAGEGVVDTVTSPGQVVEGVAEDVEEHGPVVGTVTGSVKGGAKAAAQAVEGAAKVGVGTVETILSPVTGE